MRACVLIGLASCFDPQLTPHLPCAQPDNWCPAPQTCGTDGYCEGGPAADGDGGHDAGLPDANLVFTSSQSIALGQMTNAEIISLADQTCQRLGTTLRPGTYIAWLGTDSFSAAARLPSNIGWVRPDGKPFASSVQAVLSQNTVYYPPRLDDTGADVVGARVDTPVATQLPMADGCTGTANVVVGSPDGDALSWLGNTDQRACSTSFYLYCFETDRAVAIVPPTRNPSLAWAFVTAGMYAIQNGVGELDTDCQKAANAAGLGPRTFHAFVAPTGASASSRFTPSTRAWARLDGVVIAEPGLTAFTAPLAVDELEDHINLPVGFGANSPTSDGGDTANCQNWSGGGDNPATGVSTRSNATAFVGSPGTCAATYLYCLETPP
jgi:hypothetical protein